MNTCRNIILAVTGASGSVYARRFMERALALRDVSLHLVLTDTAREVWRHELECEPPREGDIPSGVTLLDDHGFEAPFCSGSAAADALVILPCSMGMLGRIAAGTADDAIARMADVQLKERRPLIVVPRETPLNLIHLRNMATLTEAGAVIAPAAPGFYSRPASLDALVDSFVARVMQLAGIASLEERYKWK
ncbi:MAG: UbiX family flavin prenyltransferase [Bacteroidales bacterium]|nr:UbiX family flavin prenyltransferase [Bacteroidales bacterium]